MSMASLKIDMWIHSLGGGGAQRVFTQLASCFATEGHTVRVYVDSENNPYASELTSDVQLITLKTPVSWLRPRILGRLFRFTREVRQNRPDIIFSTGYVHNIAVILAGKFAGAPPVIIRETNTISEQWKNAKTFKDKIIYALARFFYPKAHAVIAPSEGVKSDLETFIPALAGKVTVIPNPIDLDDLSQKQQQALPEKMDSDFILSVGRLVPQKGYDILIRAWAKLYDRHPVKLVILGEGPERNRLAHLAKERGLQSELVMPGFDINPFRYMGRARLYVLSSYFEGLPNALLQAIACQCPVIATDCKSGPREILKDGALGPLVPAGDVDALTQAMIKTLNTPPDTQAAFKAMERYDPKSVTQEYLRVFKTLSG